MAAPGGKFFIQENLSKPAAHHESFAQLWETKWKAPAAMIASARGAWVAAGELTELDYEDADLPLEFDIDFEQVAEVEY